MVNTLYGASHILAKGVMPVFLSPNVFILFRALGATVLFWIIHVLRGTEQVNKKDFPRIAICGLFGVAVNQLFFFHGLNLSSSINSGIIMSSNPILVVILSFFVLKERISLTKSIGVLMGASGAILLTLTAGTSKGDSLLGDAFLFINAASYAIYLVLAKPLMVKYSPLTIITWVFTFGLFYILLFPPTLTELWSTTLLNIPFEIWMKIIYVVVGVTFLTYLLTMYGLKFLSPSISSVYIYVQPIMVILFAYVFYAIGFSADYTGSITWLKVIYMILIFSGVYITSMQKSLPEKRKD